MSFNMCFLTCQKRIEMWLGRGKPVVGIHYTCTRTRTSDGMNRLIYNVIFLATGPSCLFTPAALRGKETKKEKKGGEEKKKTLQRRSLLETFATVLYLLAFAISSRLPTDSEKQMLSICLSPSLISFFVEWDCAFANRVHVCVLMWVWVCILLNVEQPCNERDDYLSWNAHC